LHVRCRLAFGRSSILAVILAALTLVLVGSSAALAAGGATPTRPERATPRVQLPGDSGGFRLPFEPGLEVPIEQGWHSHYSHNGRAEYAYDFGLFVGTPVLAAASGVVSYTHSGETACGGANLLLHANYVTIDHPDGSATQYGHLSAVDVKVGDVVTVGQQIGLSGKTGYTGCMPHLHFARQAQGSPVTQSVPVYFEGYPDRELVDGEVIKATPPACGQADADAPTDAFCGTYSTRGSAAAPLFSRLEKTINFDWTAAAPGGYWLDHPVDGFSATWSRAFAVTSEGTYTIQALATDRVRVSIDGVAVIDGWTDHAATRQLVKRQTLSPGIHRMDVAVDVAAGKGSLAVDIAEVLGDEQAQWASHREPLVW
jgi:murein DD-endopeptidase MepM/ murein hydrolase activator NlpD